MSIPQINNSSFLSKVQINQLLHFLKLNDITKLDEKILLLNSDAEGFISMYLPYPEKLNDSEWTILKRLYIAFKLYEQTEQNVNDYGKHEQDSFYDAIKTKRDNQNIAAGDALKNSMAKQTSSFIYTGAGSASGVNKI